MQSSQSEVAGLIERLDAATKEGCMETITSGVKAAMIDVVGKGALKLCDKDVETCDGGYGRRLLHLDPAGRYSVVAMIWAKDQGTPIHDHDSLWCVECVYQGQIQVTTYEMCPTSTQDVIHFDFYGKADAMIGEAGALIPPHDYHVIENLQDETAVTIHVYGGEMKGCNVFVPTEDGKSYVKEHRSLCYSD
ncbi:MAG: putative metal-dependent enzyme (double-stranded beta helix superfamily) [Planctomycetota bacterium]|jgi:predicted metal-dependent enzyme (double-stranded beta helix superfamily)